MDKKKFPEELLARLRKEMPEFEDLIVFNAAGGSENCWRSIVRIIDANISLQQKTARVAKVAFGEGDERVSRAKEAAEKFQGLKKEVQSFLSA